MSYIIKKNEPLVNLKLTNTGRSNLSSGKLTLTNFSLGDSEMDYSSDTFSLVNILRTYGQILYLRQFHINILYIVT